MNLQQSINTLKSIHNIAFKLDENEQEAIKYICGIYERINSNNEPSKPELIHEFKEAFEVVLNEYKTDFDTITKKSNKEESVRPRQVLHKLIITNYKTSLSKVGAFTGGFDHATVLHSCKKIDDALFSSKKFAERFNLMDAELKMRLSEKTKQVTF